MSKGVRSAVAALKDFEAQTTGAGRNLDQVAKAGDKLGSDVAAGAQKAAASVKTLAASAQDVSGAFDKLSNTGAVLGGSLAAGIGLAAKEAAGLETAVARISTIAPEIDTSKVTRELSGMSTRVAQTSTQLAASLNNVFSSIETNQADALKLTEQFGRGAVAAGTDAEVFGTSVLGVMNAYKLSASDATHVSDVFFNTIKTGVISGDELARGLGQVTQTAKLAGVNFDTLGALIAGVTREGGEASTNINNLANALNKITTAETQKGLADLGIATKDAAGNFRSIIDVLGELKTRLATLSAGDRAKVLQDLFPDAQARAGIATLLSQLDTVKTALNDNATAAGAADAAYAKMGDTAANKAALLRNKFTAELSELGTLAMPGLLTAAEQATKALKAFDNLPDGFKGAAIAGAEIAAVFLLVSAGAIRAATTIASVAGAVATAGKGAAAAATQMYTLASSLTAVQVASVGGPLLIALGLAAAGTAITMHQMADGVREAADAIGGDLGGAIRSIDVSKLEALKSFLTGINTAGEESKGKTAAWADVHNIDEITARWKEVAKTLGDMAEKNGGRDVQSDEATVLRAVRDELQKQIVARQELNRLEEIRNRMLTSEGEAGSPFVGPIVPPGAAAGTDELATGLEAVANAAIKGSDGITQASNATATLLTRFKQTDAQKFAAELAQVGTAMSGIQSATAPLAAALDQINAKRAAGLPLTAQEASLLSQIPGYLGEAASATSNLAVVQAQLAINSINAQGGIGQMAGAFGGAQGQAAGLAGELNRLQGIIIGLDSAYGALGQESGKLSAFYNDLEERAKVLEQQKEKGGKGLNATEAAELAHIRDVQKEIGGILAENAAKKREIAELEVTAARNVRETAAAEAEARAAAAKQPAVIVPTGQREDRTGITQTVPPVPVQLEPAVDDASLAAVRKVLATPVKVPVEVESKLVATGLDSATAEAMGIIGGKAPQTQTLTITATDQATPVLTAVQDRLIAINSTPTLATLNAQDNASQVANGVTEAVKRIPEIHSTTVNAVDNASGPLSGILGTINSIPTSFSITANVDISGALANIQALSNQIPRSPAKEGPFKQLPNWHALYESLVPAGEDAVLSIQDTTQQMARAIGDGIDSVTSESAKSAAELASQVAAAVSATTDALAKLRTFRAPNPAQFAKLRGALLPVVDLFAADATARGEGTKAAADWAEQVSKIVGMVGTGVDALSKLSDFQRPSDQAVRDFRDVSQFVGNVLSRVAHDSDADLTEAGATYAEAASTIYSSVGTGVDALVKLQDFKRPTDKAVTDFRDVSQYVVNLLAQVARDIDADALPDAAAWADTASKIFGALGSGVDALTKLHDFERPTDQAVGSFRDVSQYVVNLLAQVAADIEGDALPQASAWAETAGKIFAALGSGVDALSKVEGFERPTDAALRSLRDVTQLAVTLIAESAAALDGETVANAATYSDAASKVVALVGNGAESFAKLATGELALPDRGRLQAFAAATQLAVIEIAAASKSISGPALAAAATYADGAGKVVSLIGGGVEGFSKLAAFTAPSAAQIAQFKSAVSATVIQIAQAAREIDKDAVKAAGEYSDGAGKAVSLLGSAVSAFNGMKDFAAPSKEGIDALVSVTNYGVQQLIGISGSYGKGQLGQLKEFSDAASSGFGALRGALDAGKSLADKDRIAPADAIGQALAEFQAGLSPLGQLLTLSQQYKTQGEQIGANVAQAYAAIAAGLPGFNTQQAALAANVTVGAGQTTIVHRFEGSVNFGFLGENGAWVVKSLQVDDGALTATADLIAGKLLPIFEAAIEEA